MRRQSRDYSEISPPSTPTHANGHSVVSSVNSPTTPSGKDLSGGVLWVEYSPQREPIILRDEMPLVPGSKKRYNANNIIPPLDIEAELMIVTPDEPDTLEEVMRDGVSVAEGKLTKKRKLDLPAAVVRTIPQLSDEDLLATHFSMPTHYIRQAERLPDEINEDVEYDMDSEDEDWLANFNKGRRAKGLLVVSEDEFEYIIDKLEKGTFAQQKQVVETKMDEIDPSDIVCCVCGDDRSDDANLIVFCDGCNLSVHQDCYGIVTIPEGRWYCQTCEKKAKPQCLLCPNDGGAYKRTTDGQNWAHVACALWIPETGFEGDNCLGNIAGINKICKARWKLLCQICKQKQGACIQCHDRRCTMAFHVTCAREQGLYMAPKETKFGLEFFAYCDKHTPPNYKKEKEKQKASKEATIMIQNLEADLRKSVLTLTQAKRLIPLPSQIIDGVFEYWLNKRRKRGGLPLLKSLNALDIIRARKSGGDIQKKKSTAELLNDLIRLRKDFEKVEFLVELVKRREKMKRELLHTMRDAFELQVDPNRAVIERVLSLIDHEDTYQLFQEPVNPVIAPNYLEIVKEPMDLSLIRKKFQDKRYKNIASFWADLELMCNNAMLYNGPSTVYHKEAKRILTYAQSLKDKVTQSGPKILLDEEFPVTHQLPKPIYSPMKSTNDFIDAEASSAEASQSSGSIVPERAKTRAVSKEMKSKSGGHQSLNGLPVNRQLSFETNKRERESESDRESDEKDYSVITRSKLRKTAEDKRQAVEDEDEKEREEGKMSEEVNQPKLPTILPKSKEQKLNLPKKKSLLSTHLNRLKEKQQSESNGLKKRGRPRKHPLNLKNPISKPSPPSSSSAKPRGRPKGTTKEFMKMRKLMLNPEMESKVKQQSEEDRKVTRSMASQSPKVHEVGPSPSPKKSPVKPSPSPKKEKKGMKERKDESEKEKQGKQVKKSKKSNKEKREAKEEKKDKDSEAKDADEAEVNKENRSNWANTQVGKPRRNVGLSSKRKLGRRRASALFVQAIKKKMTRDTRTTSSTTSSSNTGSSSNINKKKTPTLPSKGAVISHKQFKGPSTNKPYPLRIQKKIK